LNNLNILREKILNSLIDNDVEVFLFGSRARGNNHDNSDVDIALNPVLSDEGFIKKVVLLKADIENMNIPYKVDLINLKEVSAEFSSRIMKEAIRWK